MVIRHRLLILADLVWCAVELESFVVHVLIQLEDGCVVAHSVGVVGSAEDCHTLVAMLPLVTLLHYLMCTSDEIQAVRVVEFTSDVLREEVSRTSLAIMPSVSLARFVRIGPKQVADASCMRHFSEAV